MTELDSKVDLFRIYTTTPHGNLQRAVSVFDRIQQDGLFFQHLVPWVVANSSVRDHRVAAIISAITSRHAEDRNIGLALYRQLPVRLAAQVVRQIKESGLNAPRSLRTETRRYLADLQRDTTVFDRVAAGNREDVKYLFSTLHISPGERAQGILFDGETPEGTVWWAIQQAAQSDDPAEQARLVVEYNIPALVATSLVSGPEGVIALVESMTPGQLQNSLQSLQAVGAMDNPDLKRMITKKLRQGQKDTRFQSAKREKVRVDDVEVNEALTEVRENVLSSRFAITRPTALLVDMSSSMAHSISLAKQIGPQIAQASENGLWVYAFNDSVRAIQAENTLSSWENAFSRVHPLGNTSFGAPVRELLTQGIKVEQMMFITDQWETTGPYARSVFDDYRRQFGEFDVIVAHVDNGAMNRNDIERVCSDLKINCDTYRWTGDYTAMDNLMQLLSGKSNYDIVREIMAWPIPVRLSI